MAYFRTTDLLTGREKQKISEMSGTIMFGILEGRSDTYIADTLGLSTQELNHNIDEVLYTLKNRVGIWRYIKMLFIK